MILITGGSGYIGSHTLIEIHNAKYEFIVYDNLSNSSQESLKRASKIINKNIIFEKGDIRDEHKMEHLFNKYDIDSVIHFAGLKAVGESVNSPLEYYDNNVNGTLVLLRVMKKFNCKKIVFSSSATVYQEQKNGKALTENLPLGATSPYGKTKLFIEEILKGLYISDNDFKVAILRYFNPVGAHESGTIGEDPNGIPNNLTKTAIGEEKYLKVFGGNYDTHDGTGVRDYIHIYDLAIAHTKALHYLHRQANNIEPLVVNIGTGIGYSVLDVITAFKKSSGKEIPYKIVQRRDGDIAAFFADSSYAKEVLGWEATKTIEDMCKDSWIWQSKNPNGYKDGKY